MRKLARFGFVAAASIAWAPAASAGECPGPPLLSTLDDPPYLIHVDGGSTDVTTAVTGGVPPYNCQQYVGPGRGTLPDAISHGACTISGGASDSDPDGSFGFTMRVTDSCGATIDIPIAMLGDACTAQVGLEPDVWPIRVPDDPLAGYAWGLTATIDLFAPECAGCALLTMITLSPWTIGQDLLCANEGILCSDCDGCIEEADTCPDELAMVRAVTVKPHTHLREDQGPVWLTLTLDLQSSGTQCPGDESWACHLEVLELVPTLPFLDDFESGGTGRWSQAVGEG